jgi:hypothetical protein
MATKHCKQFELASLATLLQKQPVRHGRTLIYGTKTWHENEAEGTNSKIKCTSGAGQKMLGNTS